MYAAAIALASVQPWIACTLYFVVAVILLVPDPAGLSGRLPRRDDGGPGGRCRRLRWQAKGPLYSQRRPECNNFVCAGTKTSALFLVRVLIADDEKAFSTVLADLVRSCGHEVVAVVHSGLDAIRSYRQHKPDVVLMDFSMARLNGLTACRNILSEDPDGCVLFLSGLSERSELTPESSGALAVLQKPISRARLEQVLNEASSRRHVGTPKKAGETPPFSADLQN